MTTTPTTPTTPVDDDHDPVTDAIARIYTTIAAQRQLVAAFERGHVSQLAEESPYIRWRNAKDGPPWHA